VIDKVNNKEHLTVIGFRKKNRFINEKKKLILIIHVYKLQALLSFALKIMEGKTCF